MKQGERLSTRRSGDYQPGGVASQANTHMHPRTIHSLRTPCTHITLHPNHYVASPPCKAGGLVPSSTGMFSSFPSRIVASFWLSVLPCHLMLCFFLFMLLTFFLAPNCTIQWRIVWESFCLSLFFPPVFPFFVAPPLSFPSWRLKNWLPEVNFNTKFHNCEI